MCHILIADDDLVQLHLRKTMLESAGHEVVAAFNPGDALRHSGEGWAHLLIVDLRFLNPAGQPDAREGLALIRGIRERGCQTPVIVLSGWPEELYGQPEEGMVSRIMVKPVPAHEMLETVLELASP